MYFSTKLKKNHQFQDKTQPFISDGFEAQTIHSQPIWLQAVMRISAGLKGFSGKLMRNARARKHISVLFKAPPNVCWKRTFVQGERRGQVYLDYAEPPPKVHVNERIYLTTKFYCPRISRIFVQASAEPNLFGLYRAQPKMSRNLHEYSCPPC